MESKLCLNFIEEASLEELLKKSASFVEGIENGDTEDSQILDIIINVDNITATIYFQE